MLGLDGKKRSSRWIRSEYVTGPGSFNKYKVVAPASRGHLGKLGKEPALILGEPLLGEPQVAVTQTFITIGSFDTRTEADACLKYVKSKFARDLLGVLKVTQHNPARAWKYVPLQDFTSSSDIDWSKPGTEIDQQLYAKYGLDTDEIQLVRETGRPIDWGRRHAHEARSWLFHRCGLCYVGSLDVSPGYIGMVVPGTARPAASHDRREV